MSRQAKKPSRLAPIVMTGIAAGVLYKAYKAIFTEPKLKSKPEPKRLPQVTPKPKEAELKTDVQSPQPTEHDLQNKNASI